MSFEQILIPSWGGEKEWKDYGILSFYHKISVTSSLEISGWNTHLHTDESNE